MSISIQHSSSSSISMNIKHFSSSSLMRRHSEGEILRLLWLKRITLALWDSPRHLLLVNIDLECLLKSPDCSKQVVSVYFAFEKICSQTLKHFPVNSATGDCVIELRCPLLRTYKTEEAKNDFLQMPKHIWSPTRQVMCRKLKTLTLQTFKSFFTDENKFADMIFY